MIFYTGMSVSVIGIGWALAIDLRYGVVVFAGWFFDVVYTLWLKRRTYWSIVWGGISGAMPILAGRVLAFGEIDVIGLLPAGAVLFWIPTHIMTFSIKYADDYAAAGVPTFPSTYGLETTRAVIALSSIVAAASMGVAGVMIGVQAGILRLLIVLSSGLLLLSFTIVFHPSERVNFSLFKYASWNRARRAHRARTVDHGSWAVRCRWNPGRPFAGYRADSHFRRLVRFLPDPFCKGYPLRDAEARKKLAGM